MFPPTAIFNTRIDDVSRFPAHPQSWNWINRVGSNVPFRTDWGVNDNPAMPSSYWGIPINVVDGSYGTTDWAHVSFDFTSSGQSTETGWPYKSDCAIADGNGFNIVRDCTSVPASSNRFPFPLPSKVLNENGQCGGPNDCGDHHVLVVEAGACRLWEAYYAHRLNNQWFALTTAAWNLRSLDLRPADWASGDAAGLPIAPLLAKAAEASSGEIKHALRVTFRDSNIDGRAYDWPARHAAGGEDSGAIPFGALLRLKADFVIPNDWTPQAKALATAAKRYGLYVSDNGENFYVQGEPNSAWNERTFWDMQNIKMSDMEFVDLKSIKNDSRFNPNSMAASW